jgi:hypothetical protein
LDNFLWVNIAIGKDIWFMRSKIPVSWVKKELKMGILREGETGKGIIISVRIKSGGKIPEEIGTKAYADLSTKSR